MKQNVQVKNKNKPLKALMTKQKIATFKELANKSGVSYDSLLSYNIGRRSPTLEAATKLCRSLKCSLKELAKALDIDTSGVPNDKN